MAKIGHTSRLPLVRCAELGVTLVGCTPGDRNTERALHQHFARERMEGTEWFTYSPRLRAYAESLPDWPITRK